MTNSSKRKPKRYCIGVTSRRVWLNNGKRLYIGGVLPVKRKLPATVLYLSVRPNKSVGIMFAGKNEEK